MNESKLILEKESFAIRGACFEVYQEKGCGFVEAGETMKLRWRSEEERARFEATEKQKYAAWDAFISGRLRN